MPRFLIFATTSPRAASASRTSAARSRRSSRPFDSVSFRYLSTRRRIGANAPPASTEERWQPQFESAHFITLGLLYEENKRFAGGAVAPILRRGGKVPKPNRVEGPAGG